MDEKDITLTNILISEGDEFAAKATPVLKLEDGTASLREKLLQLFSKVAWPSINDAIAQRIQDITDVSLPDLLLAAWKKYQMIEQYADSNKFPPHQSNFVALEEHSIKSEHHPAVEVLVDGQPIAKFVFDINLELDLKGFVLRIEDARIKEIHTGSMQAKGSIAFRDVVLVEKEFHPVQLPGVMRLGEGVSLAVKGAAA